MFGGWLKKRKKTVRAKMFGFSGVLGVVVMTVACVCFVISSPAYAGMNVPSQAQNASSAVQNAAATPAAGNVTENLPQEKININKADKDTLLKIKGLGPTKAQNILDYRKKFGPFKKYEDLLKVKGIGEKTLELIKPFITL